ncbi:MAG: HAMP domain-containing histidine kinase [Oscillatoriales cyanobacterium SM2_2_1]|nr:HAMP domain-containing histidine kinase [Oscillatoriales cyanobacterium SM2_2_1]
MAAHRQVQVFLHSVSHDLQTPVVGAAVVFKSLLSQPDDQIQVNRSVIERLLQGSDRQIALIDELIESHITETQGITLHCEPIRLKPLVDAVLFDLHHYLVKKQVQLSNHISDELPLVTADANQLWRVFSNLVKNALQHNPPSIHLILDAIALEPGNPSRNIEKWVSGSLKQIQQGLNRPMLLCIVQDNGVGIAPAQGQQIFELYTRGVRVAMICQDVGLAVSIFRFSQKI